MLRASYGGYTLLAVTRCWHARPLKPLLSSSPPLTLRPRIFKTRLSDSFNRASVHTLSTARSVALAFLCQRSVT